MNLFSKHFNLVYSDSNIKYILSTVPYLVHDLPNSCFFYLSQVENGSSRLKNNKSVDSNDLSGEFLHDIRSSLCFPL